MHGNYNMGLLLLVPYSICLQQWGFWGKGRNSSKKTLNLGMAKLMQSGLDSDATAFPLQMS